MSRSVDPTADAVRYVAERRRQGKSYDRDINAAWYQGTNPPKRKLRLSVTAVVLIVATLLCLPITLTSVAGYVFVVPDAVGMGLIFCALYLLIGTLIFRASPMWPAAGWLWYLLSLLWGGVVSLMLVFFFAPSVSLLIDKLGIHAFSASFAGAYPEEIAKAFGVLLILYAFPQLNRPWHGFVTGGLVGLGFEVVENFLYGGMGGLIDANNDFDGVLSTWAVRSIAGPGLHVFLTALAGYGIGYALYTYGISRGRRIGVALGALFVAFLLHFAWNMQLGNNTLWVAQAFVVGVILYAITLYLWLKAHRDAKADSGVTYMHQPITDLAQLPLSISGMQGGMVDADAGYGVVTLDANSFSTQPVAGQQPAEQPGFVPGPQTSPYQQ